jgi:hypothetical protein
MAVLIDIQSGEKFSAYLIPKEQVLGKYTGTVMIHETDPEFRYIKIDARSIVCEAVNKQDLIDWTVGTEVVVIL